MRLVLMVSLRGDGPVEFSKGVYRGRGMRRVVCRVWVVEMRVGLVLDEFDWVAGGGGLGGLGGVGDGWGWMMIGDFRGVDLLRWLG